MDAHLFLDLADRDAIAGAGLLSVARVLSDGEGITASTIVGMVVAAITGYWAIAFLIRVLARTGLAPFGIYCVTFGVVALIAL